jgi:hypothetical protein
MPLAPEIPNLSAAHQRFVVGRSMRDVEPILRGDGSFGGFAECCGYCLAVHEEFPDQVAATIQNFLLGGHASLMQQQNSRDDIFGNALSAAQRTSSG